MLRTAADTFVSYEPDMDGPGWLVLHVDGARSEVSQIDRDAFRGLLRLSTIMPQPIATDDGETLWMFREAYYRADACLTGEELRQAITRRFPAA